MSETYPEAPQALIDTWNIRRRALVFAEGEALPPMDCDLATLRETFVAPPAPLPNKASGHAIKCHEIRTAFIDQSELAALNGLLISHLRKKRYPRHAPRLFRRLWQEEQAFLLENLSPRWLISSIITFGDHGWNEGQRRIGLAMNILFSLMKLYEYERLHSGHRADQPFTGRKARPLDMPLDMPPFALLGGGLDINLLAQIWQMALDEPVAGPLACHLLTQLNEDPRGLFRRLGLMRAAKQQRQTPKIDQE